MARLQFWFEYASTYSYISAMRISSLAADKGVEIDWKPFLLGPVFAAAGWNDSPFNIYPVKGRYMWRDMARLTELHGLPALKTSGVFPQNTILAARIGLVAHDQPWGPDYTRAAYTHQFAEGGRLDQPEAMAALLERLGQHPGEVISKATEQGNKDRLRAQTEAAIDLGIFGAPAFVAPDGELFWGDDRLEQALEWALKTG